MPCYVGLSHSYQSTHSTPWSVLDLNWPPSCSQAKSLWTELLPPDTEPKIARPAPCMFARCHHCICVHEWVNGRQIGKRFRQKHYINEARHSTDKYILNPINDATFDILLPFIKFKCYLSHIIIVKCVTVKK